jgi:hypothetical protein
VPTTLVTWLSSGGALAIISAFVYAIMRGHLVPKSSVDEMRKDRDGRLSEQGQIIDMWRNAALVKDQALSELIPMLEEVVTNDQLILKLLTAIKDVVDKTEADGDHNA